MLGFFGADDDKPAAHRIAGPKARKGQHIPIQTMNQQGCKACPSDRDTNLKHPKLEAQGKASPRVYVLLSAPSIDEDASGRYLDDRAGDALYEELSKQKAQGKVRVHATVRCYQKSTDNWQKPEIGPTECCRGYIERDIEEAAPLIVIGVGDAALRWATGLSSALTFRGTLIATRIGRHACWFLPIIYPNFAFKEKRRNPSEYELAFAHDIRKAIDLAEGDLKPPKIHDAPYDRGVEIITGQEGGDMARLEEALHSMLRNKDNALDWETNGLRPWSQRDPHIWTASIGTFERTVAFPIDHPEGWGTDSRMRHVRGAVGQFILESGPKIAHNAGFEMEWANYVWGAELLRLTDWEDTQAAAHTLDEREGTKSLGVQTRINFGFDVKAQSKVDAVRLLDYPIKEALRYNGMDSKWTHLLHHTLRPRILARAGDTYEYNRKVRLAPTLVLTQAKGLYVDIDYAKQLRDKYMKQLDEISAKIFRTPEVREYEKRYGTYRIGNDDDVLKLMKMLKRPEIRIDGREGVQITTAEAALSAMPADEVPSAKLILEERGLSKLEGTYLSPIISGKIIDPDGRMRTSYSSMKAVTGRLNSYDPNLQNFPKRKHREVRGVVYAPPGKWMNANDYGQIEARVFAMASEDEALMRALWTGYDIHGYWADWFLKHERGWADYLAKEYSVDRDDPKKIRKTARDSVKNQWVFPQFFGSMVRSCAEDLHVSEDVAERASGEFWDEFKGVKKWQEKLLRDYERNLYVETLTGRRERGPLTKNQLLNQPIQGTAADIVTDAMCQLSEQAFIEDDEELQPSLNVHDDLTTYLSDEGMEAKIEKIARIMCKPRFSFINVPIIVEAQIGTHWHTLKDYHIFKSNEMFDQPNPFERDAA